MVFVYLHIMWFNLRFADFFRSSLNWVNSADGNQS